MVQPTSGDLDVPASYPNTPFSKDLRNREVKSFLALPLIYCYLTSQTLRYIICKTEDKTSLLGLLCPLKEGPNIVLYSLVSKLNVYKDYLEGLLQCRFLYLIQPY